MSANNGNEPSISERLDMGGRLAKKNSIKRWLIIGVIAVLTITLIAYQFSKKESVTQFKTELVTQGNMTIAVTATGTLQPLNQVQLGSEISGLVDEVLVDFNDHVKKDQVLARLNTDQLKGKLQQSQAAYRLAEAKLNEVDATVTETKNFWQRKEALGKEQLCSLEECEAAKAAYLRARASYASAKAQVSQAKAQVDLDLTTLKKAVIRSPIDGIVLSRNVETGQTVAASFQTPVLFTLAEDLTRMELHVDIDEADVGTVRENQKAKFSVDAHPQQHFSAHITKVYFAPKVVQDVVTYEALLTVDNTDMLLRPGMTATAEIITHQINNAILVPNTALRFSPASSDANNEQRSSVLRSILPGPRQRPVKARQTKGGEGNLQTVWTLKSGEPAEIPISVGLSNGRMTEVISGDIKPGMELLVDVVRVSK